MKHLIKLALLLLALLLPATATAYNFEVDGIYYNILNDNEVEVTYHYDFGGDYYYSDYSGSVTIPSSVYYNGTTYSVTSIGDYAFTNCRGLTSVTIPNSVTTVGGWAFYNCSSLTSIGIPNSVTTIGYGAFSGCNALTSVTIPNSVTTVGDWAFYNCSSLTSIGIPNSVTTIGYGAFSGCNALTSMIVVSGNTVYDSRNNCNAIIETASNTLIIGCKNSIIPNSVSSIGEGAFFGCTGLTNIDIPNSVMTISWGAFEGCNSLTSIDIPNSVTSIGDNAFSGCSGLTSVTIGNSVSSIGDNAFSDCSSLTSIDIPNSVTSIGDNAFSGCSGLTSVTIGNSVSSIGDNAFSDCSSLTSIDIPNSVTTIGRNAFDECSGLTSVTIPNSVTSIGDNAFSGCNNLNEVYSYITDLLRFSMGSNVFYRSGNYANRTLYVPVGTSAAYQADTKWSKFFGQIVQIISFADASVKAICVQNWDTNGDSELSVFEASVVTDLDTVFKGNSSITSFNELQYFTGLLSITSSAFYNCSGLTSVTIPNSVTFIGSSSFYNCSALNEVYSYIEDVSSISMGSNVFYRDPSNYGVRILYVPKGTLSDYQEDTNWSRYFGQILEIRDNFISFADANVKAICVQNWDTNRDGELSEPEAAAVTDLGSVFQNTNITSFNELQYFTGLESISAFYGCSSLTSVTIPNSVTTIGDLAFYGCSGLTSIEIPNSVTTIGRGAFDGCNSLTSIDIPNSVTSIGNNAFSGCSGLTSIEIPNSVTTIGNYAFSGCSGLTSMNVASGNTVYDSRNNCNAIIETVSNTLIAGCKNTIIPNSVTTIGDLAFYGCSGLTSIDIPNSITSIGNSAFYGCSGLTSVTIPNSVTSISDNAFSICFGLTSIDIPNSVTSIGGEAFMYCFGLTSVTIPNSVTTISYGAFRGCSGLTSITIPNSVTTIGEEVFYGCRGLTSIIVANGNSFYDSRNNCNAIIETTTNKLIAGCKNTIIPNSVTTIGSKAFSECSSLTSITIPNSVTSIGFMAFFECIGLTSIDIPNSVTSIVGSAFNGCSGLTSVNIPNSVTFIDNSTFFGCSSLTSVNIPNSVTSIDDNAFCYCSGLTRVTIPNSVTYIGERAFGGCSSLDEVYSYITDLSSIMIYDEWVFGRYPENYENRTLYVPLGTSAAYQADRRWRQCFGSIVEMGNYFTIPDTTVFHGDTIVIPVKMFNEADVISFQTDIVLPEGLELLQEDGEFIIDPSERMTRTHSIMSNQLPDGSIRVLCYSSNYKPFTGNSGDDLFYLTVKVADDAEGDYTIQLKNTLLTNADFVDLSAPDVAATVNVKAYILGDANNSGLVTVGDVVTTAQYVLLLNPQPFNFEAADVNFDGNITVGDVSRIAWMVLNPGAKAPRRAPALLNSGDRMSGEGISLMPGETRRVSLALDNAMDYSAFQLDLSLPEGLTASNFQLTDRAGSHAFDVNTLGGGKFRALCYSPVLTAISGHEGALVTFHVTANAAVTGTITVDGIELVTTACEGVRLDGFAIDVNSTSGVNEQVAGKTVARVDYYNLAGQQIDRPEAGVTLVVTTYTDGTRTTTKKLIK